MLNGNSMEYFVLKFHLVVVLFNLECSMHVLIPCSVHVQMTLEHSRVNKIARWLNLPLTILE